MFGVCGTFGSYDILQQINNNIAFILSTVSCNFQELFFKKPTKHSKEIDNFHYFKGNNNFIFNFAM